MRNRISFMSANYVARETGWAMHGWGHGDRMTNDAFRPIGTYADRFGALLGDVRALGFDTIDIWGAHLNVDWATDEHLGIARRLLDEHQLAVGSYQVWLGAESLERGCDLAVGLGSSLLSGNVPLEDPRLESLLSERGLRFAYENHPERAPAEVLAKLPPFAGVCIDTGWFGTHGYDAAKAIDLLGSRIFHVHLKDVLAAGEPHETCPYGKGVVDIEACVQALGRVAFAGTIVVEHEPEDRDPSEEIRAMRGELERWLG